VAHVRRRGRRRLEPRSAAEGPKASSLPVVIDESWQRQLADRLARQMGDEEWVAIGELWEPTHRGIVVDLADVVDDLLTQTLPATPTGLRTETGLRELLSRSAQRAIRPRNPNLTDR